MAKLEVAIGNFGRYWGFTIKDLTYDPPQIVDLSGYDSAKIYIWDIGDPSTKLIDGDTVTIDDPTNGHCKWQITDEFNVEKDYYAEIVFYDSTTEETSTNRFVVSAKEST